MTSKLVGVLIMAAAFNAFSQEAAVNAEEMKELWARARDLEALLEKMEVPEVETTSAIRPTLKTARKSHQAQAKSRRLGAHEETQGRRLSLTSTTLDTLWLLLCGALVMFMQAGFAILEAGSVTYKNTGLVLLKNLMDVCMGTLAWYFLGYGIAYGIPETDQRFIGVRNFAADAFLETDSEDAISGTTLFRDWFFQWAFCGAAATIVSGGVAERISLPAYVLYSIWMTAFIYPCVVFWTWSGSGWLTIGSGDLEEADGYSDYAGSGIVHLVGGIGALTGAILVGPRKGRFTNTDPDAFKPCNPHFCVLGTFILWFGWYGFNCGSELGLSSSGNIWNATLVAMNSTMAAAAGGATVFFTRLIASIARGKMEYDVCGMCNGVLAGLVAICAGCFIVEPSWAMVTGALGGIFMEIGHYLLIALKIDDPLDAFPVHGMGGLCGMLTRPLLDHTGAKSTMFGWHVLAFFAISAWVVICSSLLFLPLKLTGFLRVSEQEEREGGDRRLSNSPVKPYEAEPEVIAKPNADEPENNAVADDEAVEI